MPPEGPRRRTTEPTATNEPAQQQQLAAETTKKKAPPTQQQRMLRQMKAQQEMERQQNQVVEAYTGSAFSDQLWKLLKTLLLIFVIGGGVLYYYSPAFLNKWLKAKPQLPPRSLISVYPETIDILRDLPRFFHEYSLATPENLHTREAIRHIASLRRTATNPGSKYKQTIRLWPWELRQFRSQLPNRDTLDKYCGHGADALYKGRPALRDDILLWCLLSAGHDHGFLRFEVQQVYGSIARGIKGVIVRYDGHPNRAMAGSFLLLPFHKVEDLQKGQPLPPSTQVAARTMSWLLQNAPLIEDEEEFTVAMEDYLYYAASKEENSWHWMHAACTAEERQARQGEPRVATMCAEGTEERGDDCCVIFDPNLHEFYGRPKSKASLEKEGDEGGAETAVG